MGLINLLFLGHNYYTRNANHGLKRLRL